MELLPLSYKSSNLIFEQIKVTNKGAIYRAPYVNGLYVFEVFKIIETKDTLVTFAGNSIPTLMKACQRIPTNESFGKWAWTVVSNNINSNRAYKIFNEIENNIR